MKIIMWNWICVQVLLGLISIAISQHTYPEPYCPPDADIYPCYCSSDYEAASVTCEKIRDIGIIKNVLKNLRGQNISYVFYRCQLGDIPSDLFKGQKSTTLDFTECDIESFGDRPFTGLEETLDYLSIDDSIDKRKKDLETMPLGHLKKLRNLSFTTNDIKRLGNDWFKGGPATVRHLMLESNDIEEIGDHAFSSLINIEYIYMGENRFKKVYRTMFPRPAKKLHTLEMSFSEIEELPKDIFEDMPALKSINVSGNKLKSAPEHTWGKVWNQLEEVYLHRRKRPGDIQKLHGSTSSVVMVNAGNSGFQCDENLKWIYKRQLPKIFRGTCTNGKYRGKNLEDLKLSDFE